MKFLTSHTPPNHQELNMVIFLNHIYLNKHKPTHPPHCLHAQRNSSATTWHGDSECRPSPHPDKSAHQQASHIFFRGGGGCGRETPGGNFSSLRAAGFEWSDVTGVCSWHNTSGGFATSWHTELAGRHSAPTERQHQADFSCSSNGALTPHAQI